MSSGIVGGWSRGAMTAAQAAMMVKSMGAAKAANAATKAIPTPGGGEGSAGFSAPSSGGGGVGAGGGGATGAGRAGVDPRRQRVRSGGAGCRCGRWSGGTRRGRGRRCVDGSQDGHERRHGVDIGGVAVPRRRALPRLVRALPGPVGEVPGSGGDASAPRAAAAGGDLVVAFGRSTVTDDDEGSSRE